MQIPDIMSDAKVAPQWKFNEEDFQKIFKQTVQFFAAPILMYLFQVSGALKDHGALLSSVYFIPDSMTIGAIETWGIGILINFFLKFSDGKPQ